MFVSFYILPLISAVVWIGKRNSKSCRATPTNDCAGMLVAMLAYWLANGSPVYPSMETGQTIAYMFVSDLPENSNVANIPSRSDVGASELKPLFIAGSCITTIFLDLSFAADRWLRHRGALVPNTHWSEKVLSALAMLAAIVGTVGLICLSIFDTRNFPRRHDQFLGCFIVGYVVSAIFLCAEFQRLGKKYRQHSILRISFWIKLVFILVEVGLAVAFGVLSRKQRNIGAIIEWVIALVFTFWVLSFVVDLLPAIRKSGSRWNQKHGDLGEGAGVELGGHGQGVHLQDGNQQNGYRSTASNF